MKVVNDIVKGDLINTVTIIRKGGSAKSFDSVSIAKRIAEQNRKLAEKNRKIIPESTSAIDTAKVPDSAQARAEEVSVQLLVVAYKGIRSPKQNIYYDKSGAKEAAAKLSDLARRKGVSFSDLIKRFSDLPQQPKLPLLSAKNNLSDFLQPALKLKVGQISDPVDSPYGFLIFNRVNVDAVTASHILISYKGALRSEKDRDRRDARKLAEKILKELKSGRDFAELARKHSDGPSGPKGGELGRFERGQMVPEFDQAVFGLETGAISEVVETKFGYHIIKRTK
jgi:parvulin-like peptidyl-prolyl isomerase